MSGRGVCARILVVEDEAVVAVDIQGHLEKLGYEVVGSADTGKEAIALIEELTPDLVLLDVKLKDGIDGIEVARRIRETRSVPVVFLTAFADDDTLDRAKAVGPYGYLVKPYDEQDLRVSVEVALYKRGLEEELEKSRADLLTVLDCQRHGTVIIDEGGKVSFLSRAAREILAQTQEEAVGVEWEEALPFLEGDLSPGDRSVDGEAVPRRRYELESGSATRAVEVETVEDPRSDRGKILFLYDTSEVRDLQSLLESRSALGNMVGESHEMARVFELIRDVSTVDVSVLILGETGTGKELVASAIHSQSARRHQPFVAINCGGLGEELAASLLFGHRRGAFTGAASDHRGHFEAAHGGTLFLDEIGDLSPGVQSALLRVLEQGTLTRLGETHSRRVDVRVIAATHRDLAAEIADGRFRADLFYRIRGAQLDVPPLRARHGDILLLAATFLTAATREAGKSIAGFSESALQFMLRYSWPGNVRELKNAIRFAVVRSRSTEIEPGDLPPEVLEAQEKQRKVSDSDLIRAALAQTHGNKKEAARVLGISRATLYRRLDALGID